MIDDIKNMIKKEFPQNEADEIIEKIFYKNSEKLFFSGNNTKQPVTKTKNNKAFIIGGLLTFLGGLLCLSRHKKNKENANNKNLSCVI